jgi:hypothetical protein
MPAQESAWATVIPSDEALPDMVETQVSLRSVGATGELSTR